MNIDLSTCSNMFLKGVSWLENNLKFDKKEIKNKIKELEKDKADTDTIVYKFQIEYLYRRLKLKYLIEDVESIYILMKINSNIVNDFLSIATKSIFWVDANDSDWIFEDPHLLLFLKELGLENHEDFLEIINNFIKEQTVEGFINSNEAPHSGFLRVLVAVKPASEALINAVNYWLKNWKTFFRSESLSIGILALTELNYFKYLYTIQEQIDFLKNLQSKDGSWFDSIKETSYDIWAISRVNGVQDPTAQKGLKWLKEKQLKNGSWNNRLTETTHALLGLLVMGEGPKESIELVNFQFNLLNQKLKDQKAILIHTSPLYKGISHINEIYKKISQMFANAQKEIRITTPYIDMFYDEIINLIKRNPNLIVKIIVRPFKDIKGERKRIAKNAIEQLKITTRGNLLQSELVHSRLIIIDDNEVLVSSADLTRAQLFDEYNVGIWTSDKEIVKKAIDFFNNLFQFEK